MDQIALNSLSGPRASYQLAHSAMPDAPVVEPRPRRPHAVRTRLSCAAVLRRLADRVTPAIVDQPCDRVPHGAW